MPPGMLSGAPSGGAAPCAAKSLKRKLAALPTVPSELIRVSATVRTAPSAGSDRQKPFRAVSCAAPSVGRDAPNSAGEPSPAPRAKVAKDAADAARPSGPWSTPADAVASTGLGEFWRLFAADRVPEAFGIVDSALQQMANGRKKQRWKYEEDLQLLATYWRHLLDPNAYPVKGFRVGNWARRAPRERLGQLRKDPLVAPLLPLEAPPELLAHPKDA